MQHNSFIFRLSASVGALLELFGLKFIHSVDLLQVHQVSPFWGWGGKLLLRLFELALAGLVTGYCGTWGKKMFEKRQARKKKKRKILVEEIVEE